MTSYDDENGYSHDSSYTYAPVHVENNEYNDITYEAGTTQGSRSTQRKRKSSSRSKKSKRVLLDPGVSDLSPQRGPSRVQRPLQRQQRGAKDRVTSPLRGATLLEVVLPEDIHREEEDKPWVGFFVMIIYCSCHLSYIV